jgi:ABC-2 type transport system ATP-binding protein
VIEIRDLYKYYGSRRALGPVSADIEQGEIIGLLGLNGAGKTTALRILACDLLPSNGSVRIDGVDVVEEPDKVRQRIGYLPDRPPLYDEMTVDEYLIFAAKLRDLPNNEISRRVGEVEESTGLTGVRDDVISSLSHGYRQRVGIAQAIVHKPKLVVLDEPITGLDPVQIVEMRDLVRSLAGQHTVLLSSHILGEISETCDRIFVIGAGKIVASGNEAELVSELRGGARVRLTVRCTESDRVRLEQAVAGISGVARLEPTTPSEPGPSIYSYQLFTDSDVREQIAKAVIGSGVGILELSRSERELENVFLELAGGTFGSVKVGTGTRAEEVA